MGKVPGSTFLKTLGENIKNAREAKGLALRDLAARSGMDHSDIAKIEKGEINFTQETLKELCLGLGIQPKVIYDFEIDLDE